MMSKFVFVVLALVAVSALGELTPPVVDNCPAGYDLSGENLGATPGFLPNLLFYNAANLMGGDPQGPWFRLNPGACKWHPAAALKKDIFNCQLTLYQNEARTQPIGTGRLYTDATNFIEEKPNGYIGGDLLLSTTIDPLLVTIPLTHNDNYVSRNTTIHFEPKQTWPDPATLLQAQANKAQFSLNKKDGVLTLWGSNGWNGQSFSGQTTGLDFRANFHCPEEPPIVEPCVSDTASTFTVAYGCVSANNVLRYHSATTSIGLSFTAGPCPL